MGPARFELATPRLKVECSIRAKLRAQNRLPRPFCPLCGKRPGRDFQSVGLDLHKDQIAVFEPGSKPRQGFMLGQATPPGHFCKHSQTMHYLAEKTQVSLGGGQKAHFCFLVVIFLLTPLFIKLIEFWLETTFWKNKSFIKLWVFGVRIISR